MKAQAIIDYVRAFVAYELAKADPDTDPKELKKLHSKLNKASDYLHEIEDK